jgi:hypothetical protein
LHFLSFGNYSANRNFLIVNFLHFQLNSLLSFSFYSPFKVIVRVSSECRNKFSVVLSYLSLTARRKASA